MRRHSLRLSSPLLSVVAPLLAVACGGSSADASSPRVSGDAGALSRCFASAYNEQAKDKDGAFNDCEARHFGSEWRKNAHAKEGAPLGTGYLDPEIIRSGISARMRRMKNCYADGLRRDPSLRGEMKFKFTIDTTGHTLNVEDAGSRMKDKQVLACVHNEFAALRFPAPEGGIVSVTYPLLLSPGDTAGD